MDGLMDGYMGGWMDSWVMDGQARGDDLGALWMMMDYATQESLSTVRSDLAPTNRGQEVDLHGICGSFGASPHLCSTSITSNNAPTPLCFTPTSTIQLPWIFPTLICSRLSKEV